MPTAPQRELSSTMIGYWTNFAHTGDPNHEGAPEWPKVKDGRQALRLAPGAIAPVDVAQGHQCDFWSGIKR